MRGVANGDFVIPPETPDARTLAIMDFSRETDRLRAVAAHAQARFVVPL